MCGYSLKVKSCWQVTLHCRLTQYGHHHVVPEDLDGTSGDEVQRGQDVSTVDQSVTRRGVGCLETHGQSSQAAFVGSSKGFTVLQQSPVQMETDVGLKTLGETLQHLHRHKHKS